MSSSVGQYSRGPPFSDPRLESLSPRGLSTTRVDKVQGDFELEVGKTVTGGVEVGGCVSSPVRLKYIF